MGHGIASGFRRGESPAYFRGVFFEGLLAAQVPCSDENPLWFTVARKGSVELSFFEGLVVFALNNIKVIGEFGEVAVAEGETLKERDDFG